MAERQPNTELFTCYHCKAGRHGECVGIPCHCDCPIPEEIPQPRQPNTELRREVEIQELACAVEDYIRDRPEEECYEGLKTLIRAFAASIQEEAQQQIEEHTQHVARFLNDMYATMIDPLAEGEIKVAEMCAALLKAATEQRQQLYDHEKQLAEARAQAFRETLELLAYVRDQEDEGLESLRQKLEAKIAIERAGQESHGNR